MKLNVLLSVITILSFMLTGCARNSLDAAKGAEEMSADFPPIMAGTVHVDGKGYEMEEGGYRWKRKMGLQTEVIMTDAAAPPVIAKNLTAIKVKPNTEIAVEIDEDPISSVFLWNEQEREQEFEVENSQFSSPSSAGRYIYEVFAKWPDGEVSYTFVIEVE